ncbi:MAG TPA: hypothetical protein VKN76_18385 [Kiloniellaceae bacterium]|nr:hypothetical protein [Kiloniellaceae bacterium]
MTRGGRPTAVLLLALWVLTGGSSCSASFNSGNFTGSASGAAAGIGIAVVLVGGGIYCVANLDDCFIDEEAQRAKVTATAAAQALFVEGLRRQRAGDPAGLVLICIAAQEGVAQAQYSYGAQLLRQGSRYAVEAKMWLQEAAARGHREAAVLLQASGRLQRVADDPWPAPGARPWESVSCPAVGPFPPIAVEAEHRDTPLPQQNLS